MDHISNLDHIEDPLLALKTLASTTPVGIQIYNVKGYSIYVNEKHRSIFGGAPPPTYCVLEDELVAASGNLHLIHKAFAGEPTSLPLFWYNAQDFTKGDVEYTKKYG